MSLEIVPATDADLVTCTPSLMPFHISYTGPAPVSRYLRTRPAPPSLATLSVQSSSTATVAASSSSISILNETKSSLTTCSSTTSFESLAHESGYGEHALLSKTRSSIEVIPQVDHVTSSLVVGTTIETDSETQPALGGGDSFRLTRLHTSAPRNIGRLVAAFRGRQMYGQAVDVPRGYGGLVLRAPLDPKRTDKEGATAPSSLHSRKAKSKSRTRATTRRSKHANPDEPEGNDEDCCPDSGANEKRLIPCSTFTSFMLWAPDRPLDEGRDEYVRALAEWTHLATEIHSYDE